MPLKFV